MSLREFIFDALFARRREAAMLTKLNYEIRSLTKDMDTLTREMGTPSINESLRRADAILARANLIEEEIRAYSAHMADEFLPILHSCLATRASLERSARLLGGLPPAGAA